VAVLFERKEEKIMRRTPFARATALIGRVSDMDERNERSVKLSIAEENRPEREDMM
jgi:hypothetical protein